MNWNGNVLNDISAKFELSIEPNVAKVGANCPSVLAVMFHGA